MVAPVTDYSDDLVAQQRAAVVIYFICVLRHRYTTDEVAHLVGMTNSGACRLMDKLSGIPGVPITRIDGRWQMVGAGRWPDI